MNPPGPRRHRSPIVLAGALAEASTKAVLGASVRLAGEAVDAVGRAVGGPEPERALEHVGRALAEGRVGVGPVRLEERHVDALRRQLASALRGLLLVDPTRQLADPVATARTVLATLAGDDVIGGGVDPEDELRRRFAALLDEPGQDELQVAAALLEVVRRLTPDQARLLRCLAEDGPAVGVTVESTTVLGRVTAVEPGLVTTLGERAGCSEPAGVPALLADLERLGLVASTVDDDLTDDPDVARIEATPAYREVADRVRAEGGRPRPRASRIELTPSGTQLLDLALSPNDARVRAPGPVRPGPRPSPASAPRPLDHSLRGRGAARVTRPDANR